MLCILKSIICGLFDKMHKLCSFKFSTHDGSALDLDRMYHTGLMTHIFPSLYIYTHTHTFLNENDQTKANLSPFK